MANAFNVQSFNKLLAIARSASSSHVAKVDALAKAKQMIYRAESSADKSLIQAQSDLKTASETFNRSFQMLSSNVVRAQELVSGTLDRVTGPLSHEDHAAVSKIMADVKEENRIADIERKLRSLPPVPTHDPSVSRNKQDPANPQQRTTLKHPPDTRTPHQQSSARTTKPMHHAPLHHAPSATPKPSLPIFHNAHAAQAEKKLKALRTAFTNAKNKFENKKISFKKFMSIIKELKQILREASDKSPKASNVKDKLTPPPTNRGPRR